MWIISSICCCWVCVCSSLTVIGTKAWSRHAERCIIKLGLLVAVECVAHVCPTRHSFVLKGVQVTILLFVCKEVVLEGHSCYILANTLSSSLSHNIQLVAGLIPSSVVTVISRLLITLISRQVVLCRDSTARMCVLLAHLYQMLHLQSPWHTDHLIVRKGILEFIHWGQSLWHELHLSSVCWMFLPAALWVVARHWRVIAFIVDAGSLVHQVVVEAYVLLMAVWKWQWLLPNILRWGLGVNRRVLLLSSHLPHLQRASWLRSPVACLERIPVHGEHVGSLHEASVLNVALVAAVSVMVRDSRALSSSIRAVASLVGHS